MSGGLQSSTAIFARPAVPSLRTLTAGVAEEVFRLFKKRYPGVDVFIIEQVSSAWRGMEVRMPDSAHAEILERHTARCDATGT